MSCDNTKDCKLCHGPLGATLQVAQPMAVSATALGLGPSPPAQVDCHANCLLFACPGCVEKDKSTYQILNMKNHIYNYHCGSCMADVPQSRRGSVESNVDPLDSRQIVF